MGVRPGLKALDPSLGLRHSIIFGRVFEAFLPATEAIFWASIISTIGPSLLTFGHLNIFRVLEWHWNLIGPCQEGKWGPGPTMLMMLAF